MDDMGRWLGHGPLSKYIDEKALDRVRMDVAKQVEEKIGLLLQCPEYLVFATDGSVSEDFIGYSGGASWYLPFHAEDILKDPLTPIGVRPKPCHCTQATMTTPLPEAVVDSFDCECMGVVHHVKDAIANLVPRLRAPEEQLAKSTLRFLCKDQGLTPPGGASSSDTSLPTPGIVRKVIILLDSNSLVEALKCFGDAANCLVADVMKALEDLDDELRQGSRHNLEFEVWWTPSHSNNFYNDVADYLAEAAQPVKAAATELTKASQTPPLVAAKPNETSKQEIAKGVETPPLEGLQGGAAIPLYSKQITANILRRLLYNRGHKIWGVGGSEGKGMRQRAGVLGAFRPPAAVFRSSPELERLYFYVWLGVLPPPYKGAAGIKYKNQVMEQECELCKWRGSFVMDHILGCCRRASGPRLKYFETEKIDNMQELWGLYKKPRLVLNFLREVNNDHKEKHPGKRLLQARCDDIPDAAWERVGESMTAPTKEKDKRENLIDAERLTGWFATRK